MYFVSTAAKYKKSTCWFPNDLGSHKMYDSSPCLSDLNSVLDREEEWLTGKKNISGRSDCIYFSYNRE